MYAVSGRAVRVLFAERANGGEIGAFHRRNDDAADTCRLCGPQERGLLPAEFGGIQMTVCVD